MARLEVEGEGWGMITGCGRGDDDEMIVKVIVSTERHCKVLHLFRRGSVLNIN